MKSAGVLIMQAIQAKSQPTVLSQKTRVRAARELLDDANLQMKNAKRFGLGLEALRIIMSRQEYAILALENEMDYLEILKEMGAAS